MPPHPRADTGEELARYDAAGGGPLKNNESTTQAGLPMDRSVVILLASLLLPLSCPIRLHPLGLSLTRSGGHATSPLLRGR